ncbi:hypothetical protein EVAR_47001_1 [Eumeta japonica]|uniref:Uncharacterized protein n=1 Tax=Eumeta variegata TaxID=151549 RepID=A0A4C1X5C1_EUMVA|nr:hypothetical protein EVAR_47001_1 [Eumeta japonica]
MVAFMIFMAWTLKNICSVYWKSAEVLVLSRLPLYLLYLLYLRRKSREAGLLRYLLGIIGRAVDVRGMTLPVTEIKKVSSYFFKHLTSLYWRCAVDVHGDIVTVEIMKTPNNLLKPPAYNGRDGYYDFIFL